MGGEGLSGGVYIVFAFRRRARSVTSSTNNDDGTVETKLRQTREPPTQRQSACLPAVRWSTQNPSTAVMRVAIT